MLSLDVGDRVELFGRLYRPSPPANPGEVDWSAWQRRRGIRVAMSCRQAEDVRRLEAAGPYAWRSVLARYRRQLAQLLVDPSTGRATPESGLLEGIILAQRSRLPQEVRQAFVRIGASHLLAVSGFHVGMLALFVYGLGRLLGLVHRQAAVLVAIVTVGYAVLAEPRPPVYRATLLAVTVCAALVLRRGTSFVNWLALAALIYLLFRPTHLFDIGLSSFPTPALRGFCYWCRCYTASVGWLDVRLRLWRGWPLEQPQRPTGAAVAVRRFIVSNSLFVALVSVAAWLSSLPLLAYHFGHFWPLGLDHGDYFVSSHWFGDVLRFRHGAGWLDLAVGGQRRGCGGSPRWPVSCFGW